VGKAIFLVLVQVVAALVVTGRLQQVKLRAEIQQQKAYLFQHFKPHTPSRSALAGLAFCTSQAVRVGKVTIRYLPQLLLLAEAIKLRELVEQVEA
jgi:hypothetical protein